MKNVKRDLLIHYDEEKDEIVFFTVAENITAEIRRTEFDGARIDIPYFKEMKPEDAERTLGETSFSLIDTFSKNKIGIRDYESLNKERHKKDIAEWETAASNGDTEAMYMLFIEYHSIALFNADAKSLEKAKKMLELSAGGGYKEAISRLENDWSSLRDAVERKIKRENKNA